MTPPTARSLEGRAGPASCRSVVAAPRAHVCAACGKAYAPGEWEAIPVTHTVSGAEIARSVVGWPSELHIDVRTCACGRLSAARGARTRR